jgi:hypothetical protein
MVSAADHRGRAAHAVPEVSEDDAAGNVKGIYDEIKSVLRVPFVPTLFRSLAVTPDCLQLAWRQLQTNAQTVYFERSADALRLVAVNFVGESGNAPSLPEDVANVVRVMHYIDPKLLIAVTVLRAATTGQRPRMEQLPDADKRRVVPGAPQTMVTPRFTPLPATDPVVQSVIADAQATLGLPQIVGGLRLLASWPELLESCWGGFKPFVESDAYRRAGRDLRLAAEEVVLDLPFRMDLSPHTLRHAGLTEADLDRVRLTLNRFHASLVVSVLFSAFLASGAFGAADAAQSPFPADAQ